MKFKKKIEKKESGFTLIELIVVIAVIGILAAVMLPKYAGFTESAQKSNVLTDAKYIATAIESMKLEDENQFATIGESLEKNVMTYVGKNLGGELKITNSNGDFTYRKKPDKKTFKVTYTSATTQLSKVEEDKNNPVAAIKETKMDESTSTTSIVN